MSTSSGTSRPPSPDVLGRAAERVARQYPRTGSLVTADESLIRREVGCLVERLTETLEGRPPRPLETEALDRVRILAMLRTETLRAWEGRDGELVAVIRAMEALQEELLEWRRGAALSDALTPFSRKVLKEVSHMLRSPLGSIVMMADAMRDARSGSLDDGQRRRLGIIHQAALGMADTASNILALVSDEDRLDREDTFTVKKLVGDVVDMVRPVTEARDRQLLVDAPDEVKRSGPALAMRQVLLTLSLRAALHAKGGEVEVTARAHGEELDFLVATRPDRCHGDDDGSSMLAMLQSDGEDGGFTILSDGLGLAACRSILQGLGSDLEVTSGEHGEYRLSFRVGSRPS